jgi:metal-responsive CopG/Arc/MetJ family transcriptional regulator
MLRIHSMKKPEPMQRFEMKAPSHWLERIDQWRGKQLGIPSRAEAIRRLVDKALEGKDG